MTDDKQAENTTEAPAKPVETGDGDHPNGGK